MPKYFSHSKPAALTLDRKEVSFLLEYVLANLPLYPLREVIGKYIASHSGGAIVLLLELQEHIEKGQNFSQFLSTYRLLPKHLIAVLASAEEVGDLRAGLQTVITYINSFSNLKRQLLLSLMYPLTILGFCMLSGLLFLFWFIPMVASSFADLGVSTPPLFLFLARTSEFLARNAVLTSSLLVAGIVLLTLLFRHYRNDLFTLAGKIPVVRPALYFWDRYQLFATLSIALRSGQGLLSALQSIRSALITPVARENLSQIIVELHEGQRLSKALSQTVFFTPELARTLRLSEDSEDLLPGVEEIERSIRNKAALAYTTFSKLVEPAIILIIGGFVFVIVLLYMQPLSVMMKELTF